MNLADLQALAASVGFPDPALAASIAMAESGGNPQAVGDTGPNVHGPSIGLWQVDLYYHPSYTQDELYDPTTNAKAALAISSGGTNWTPWSTYNAGLYKRWYTGGATPTTPAATATTAPATVAAKPWKSALALGAIGALAAGPPGLVAGIAAGVGAHYTGITSRVQAAASGVVSRVRARL